MTDMGDNRPVPDYLQDTYDLLKCALPDGIPDEEYWPVLSLLHRVMSFWTIADVLSVLTNKERSEVYNDASGFGLDPLPSPEAVEKVKQKLDACGYEEWLKQNTR